MGVAVYLEAPALLKSFAHSLIMAPGSLKRRGLYRKFLLMYFKSMY